MIQTPAKWHADGSCKDAWQLSNKLCLSYLEELAYNDINTNKKSIGQISTIRASTVDLYLCIMADIFVIYICSIGSQRKRRVRHWDLPLKQCKAYYYNVIYCICTIVSIFLHHSRKTDALCTDLVVFVHPCSKCFNLLAKNIWMLSIHLLFSFSLFRGSYMS